MDAPNVLPDTLSQALLFVFKIARFLAPLVVQQTQQNVTVVLLGIHLIALHRPASPSHLVQMEFVMFVPSALFLMEANVSNVIPTVHDAQQAIKIPAPVA